MKDVRKDFLYVSEPMMLSSGDCPAGGKGDSLLLTYAESSNPVFCADFLRAESSIIVTPCSILCWRHLDVS